MHHVHCPKPTHLNTVGAGSDKMLALCWQLAGEILISAFRAMSLFSTNQVTQKINEVIKYVHCLFNCH
jgi:hypothetical protein